MTKNTCANNVYTIMKKILFLLILVSIFSSCSNKKQEVQGDLYFKLIDIGSFYKSDDETFAKFEKSLDSLRLSKNISPDELEVIRIFDLLKKKGLLKSPWINLKTESKIIKIFLTQKEYNKIEKFKRNQLLENNKKVELKILVEELDNGIYYSNEILEFKKVDGKTHWRK